MSKKTKRNANNIKYNDGQKIYIITKSPQTSYKVTVTADSHITTHIRYFQ